MAKKAKKKKKLKRVLSPAELEKGLGIEGGTEIESNAEDIARLMMGDDVFSAAERMACMEKMHKVFTDEIQISRKQAKIFVENMTQKVNNWRRDLGMKEVS